MRYFKTSLRVLVAFGFTLLCGNTSTSHALELKLENKFSVADANYCGDINEVAVFDLKVEPEDLDTFGESLSLRKTFTKITQALQRDLSFQAGQKLDFALTAEYDDALRELTSRLGLEFDAKEKRFYLTSCHELDTIQLFGLKISKDQLQPVSPTIINQQQYFTIGAGIAPLFTTYKISVFIDMTRKKLTALQVW